MSDYLITFGFLIIFACLTIILAIMALGFFIYDIYDNGGFDNIENSAYFLIVGIIASVLCGISIWKTTDLYTNYAPEYNERISLVYTMPDDKYDFIIGRTEHHYCYYDENNQIKYVPSEITHIKRSDNVDPQLWHVKKTWQDDYYNLYIPIDGKIVDIIFATIK